MVIIILISLRLIVLEIENQSDARGGESEGVGRGGRRRHEKRSGRVTRGEREEKEKLMVYLVETVCTNTHMGNA